MKKLLLSIASLALIAFASFQANAWFNVGMVGGGVPAGGPTFGVGDILSERFGTTGSDNTDETWVGATTSGDGAWDDDAQANAGQTGFVGDHLTISYSSGQAYNTVDLGSAYTTLYARFYMRVNSDSWSDGASENFVAFSKDGGSYSSDYVAIVLQQVATDQLRLLFKIGGSDYGDINISANTSYVVEVQIVDNGADDIGRVWVDNTLEAERTGNIATFDSTGVRDIQVGLSYNTAAISVSVDTFDISSTARLSDSL